MPLLTLCKKKKKTERNLNSLKVKKECITTASKTAIYKICNFALHNLLSEGIALCLRAYDPRKLERLQERALQELKLQRTT